MQALREGIDGFLISISDALYHVFRVWLPDIWSEGSNKWLIILLLAAALLITRLVWGGAEARRERALLRAVSDGLSRSPTPAGLAPLLFEVLFRVVRAPAACFYLATLPDQPLLRRAKQANRAVATQPDWEPEMRIEGGRAEPWVTRIGNLAVVSIPVSIDGRPLALVQVVATTTRHVARVQARAGLLRAVLTPVLAQLVSVERVQRLEERATEASAVSGSSQRLLTMSMGPEELSQMLLDLVLRSTEGDAGMIVAAEGDPGEDGARVLASRVIEPGLLQPLAALLGDRISALREAPVGGALRGPGPDVAGLLLRAGFESHLEVPIADAERPLGAILLLKRQGVFHDNHVRICRLNATRLALTLRNRAYHETVFNQYKETLRAIATAGESANPHFLGHSQRVARLAAELAGTLGLPRAEVEGIRLAGELHDIGMAGLGDEIASQVGQLMKRQYDLVKHHPAIGAALTGPIQLPVPIAPLILHHHERYDGLGYPAGLKGSEIPVGARILALGEVFDALVSSRSYRPAFDFSEADRRVRGMAGTQLDPRIVEVFAGTITDERWQMIRSGVGA
jgi:hypothetical protein